MCACLAPVIVTRAVTHTLYAKKCLLTLIRTAILQGPGSKKGNSSPRGRRNFRGSHIIVKKVSAVSTVLMLGRKTCLPKAVINLRKMLLQLTIEAKSSRRDMQRALAHSYSDQELAIIAALKTVYFMAKKNLTILRFLVVQGSTDIGGLNFLCGREGRQFTYEHSESVRGFQEAIAAVVYEGLDKDLLTTVMLS